jgi:hypothetical protein
MLVAQNGTNPFDLQHRLDKQKETDTTSTNDQSNPFDLESDAKDDKETDQSVIPPKEKPSSNITSTSNPFDILRPGSDKPTLASKSVSSSPPINASKKSAKRSNKGGFMFWSLLVLMIFLALMVTLYRALLGKIYRAFSNENVLKLLQREQGGIVSPPYWLLYTLYIGNAGIFIFQLATYYNQIPYSFPLLIFCVAGVAAFFLFKHIMLKLIEGIFPISKTIKQYSFTIVIFNIILGFILVPFNIFIAFVQDHLTFTGIILGLLAVLVVYLFRLLRSIMISTKYLAFHKFHFFMYLCTIEIAPLLIIAKLLMNGVNVQ